MSMSKNHKIQVNPKKTICLNMIVKNEEHIIIETLKNLCSYINFDYWVIADTGSTDNTKKLICDFFNDKKIKGELLEHEWQDFAYNRTMAINSAFNKTDYLFIFDADDSIHNNFKLPNLYDVDKYQVKFGPNFVYTRPLLVTNRKKWCFKGVLHETIHNIDQMNGEKVLEGDYYVVSGRTGNRSKNPNKYYDDAIVLKNAFEKEFKTDYAMACRYAFYCAQSYKDSGPNYFDDSITWYKKVLELENWAQEKYYSCWMIGNMYLQKQDANNALTYLFKSTEYDPERIEGLITAMNVLRGSNNHVFVNALYYKYKNYKKPHLLLHKLFLLEDSFNDELEYHNSISSFYINDKITGYECCKQIIINGKISFPQLKSTLANILFYKELLIADTTITLDFFYKVDDIIAKIGQIKGEQIDSKIFECWEILFTKIKTHLTKYNKFTCKNKDKPKIFLSFTTCKRFDLFKQTINSILNHWTDIDKVDYWFCVDDNSSEYDRKKMQISYPWIQYYMKDVDQKGHRQSMNIIWDKLNEMKPDYWIHMEDDFLFHYKTNYITEAIKGLVDLSDSGVKQILFNRNYGETINHYTSGGDIDIKYPNIVLHDFKITPVTAYPNCHYWPYYSFRPSIIDVKTILKLGNYDSDNQFFEMDYAQKWTMGRNKSGFFNRITNRHIGRLTSDKDTKIVKNAYDLNGESQFQKVDNTENVKDKQDDSIKMTINEKENIISNIISNINNYMDTAIYCINLDRRKDRLDYINENMKLPYNRFSAIDGNNLDKYSLDTDIGHLLQSIDNTHQVFGEIGCKLSHYSLWKKVATNTLILEDDVMFTDKSINNFTETLKHIDSELEWDIIYVGGQWTPNYGINSQCHISDQQITSTHIETGIFTLAKESSILYRRNNINMSTWSSPLFRTAGAYLISKKGSDKLLQCINDDINTFMQMPLDMWLLEMEKNKKIIMYDSFVHPFYQGGFDLISDKRLLQSDIHRNNKILFKMNNTDQTKLKFIFIPGLDHIGDDIYYNKVSIKECMNNALKDENCVGFNTLGFFKSKINNLLSSSYFGPSDGLYVKEEYYHKYLNNLKNVNKLTNNIYTNDSVNDKIMVTNKIRVKMIGNFWENSKKLCDEFNIMTENDDYIYNNIEITNDDTNIDYYVIINMPPINSPFYQIGKTIIFQMEPFAQGTTYGTCNWGEWSKPDKSKFLYVNDYSENLNIAQWRFKIPISSNIIKLNNKIASVISSNNFYQGHIQRIDFLKYLEENTNNMNDVFGRQNYHKFNNYIDVVLNDNISNVLIPYKYYFMPENNSEHNYATEKIWEPILCECLCFYWGCPNLEDYIDSRAFVRLPLDNFEESVSIIKQAISEDWWSQRIDIIRQEKQKIMNNYGFFPRLEKIINNKIRNNVTLYNIWHNKLFDEMYEDLDEYSLSKRNNG